jgi:hypothetical protein
MRVCPRCAAHIPPGADSYHSCHLALAAPADPRTQDEPPTVTDSAEGGGVIEEARQALEMIERKRDDLPYSEDRKRTRRVRRAFLAGFLLVNGALAWFVLLDDGGSLASRLEIMIVGGISMGLLMGVCFAFSAGILADSVRADGFDNLLHCLTGRERKQVDLDQVAKRIHEPAVAPDPTPADLETGVGAAEPRSGPEGPPSSAAAPADAVKGAPPRIAPPHS